MKKYILALALLNTTNNITLAQEKSNGVNFQKLESSSRMDKKVEVVSFLNNKKLTITPLKNKFIDDLQSVINFDKLYYEISKDDNTNRIIVPLKQNSFSQHINKTKQAPFQYLCFRENTSGKIERVDLLLMYPENNKINSLPIGNFVNFESQNGYLENGVYSFIDLNKGDCLSLEIGVENGVRCKGKLYTKEKEVIGNKEFCREWSVYQSTINKDGTVTEKTTQLGVSCTLCPPGFICDKSYK
jgi:hypothetical protein